MEEAHFFYNKGDEMPKPVVLKKKPKPVKLIKNKVKPAKTTTGKKPVITYIRCRIEHGCKRCGGELEVGFRFELGKNKAKFGYQECASCQLGGDIEFERVATIIKGLL